MPGRVVFAEFDEHISFVPTLGDELQRIATSGRGLLIRVEPQPERHGPAPAVGLVSEIFFAPKKNDRLHLFREVERAPASTSLLRGDHEIALGEARACL